MHSMRLSPGPLPGTSSYTHGGSGRSGLEGALSTQPPFGVCMLSEGCTGKAQLGPARFPLWAAESTAASCRVHRCYAWDVAGAGRWSQRPCFLGVTCPAAASPNLDLDEPG